MIRMFDVEPDEITSGSIPRALTFLAVPLVAQNLVQVANLAADVFWLGRLGEDAVAAVGLNAPIKGVFVSFLMVSLVGTQILVSQRIGGGNRSGARKAVFHGLTLAVGTAIAVSLLVGLNAGSIVRLVGAGPEVAPLAATYLSTYLLLYPLMMASDTLEMGLIGAGDSKAAMYLNFLAIAVNLVLDPLLIYGLWVFPRLEVAGAALATGLGYTTAMCLAFYFYLGGRDSLSLGRDDVGFDPAEFREMLDIGAPLGGQRLAAQSVRVLVVGIVAVVGGAAGLAAYTVGARIASIAFVPAHGLQSAAQSMIGQNLGADRPARAALTTWTGVAIATGLLGLIGALQWLVPGLLVDVFMPDASGRAVDLSVQYLTILAYGYWAIGATYVLLAGFNGARNTKTSLVVDLAKYWGVRFPIAVAALPATYAVGFLGFSVTPGLDWGMAAIFWAVTGSNIVAAVGVAAYYCYTTSNGMLERAAEAAAAE
jgi:putative MATE family efflux protein